MHEAPPKNMQQEAAIEWTAQGEAAALGGMIQYLRLRRNAGIKRRASGDAAVVNIFWMSAMMLTLLLKYACPMKSVRAADASTVSMPGAISRNSSLPPARNPPCTYF